MGGDHAAPDVDRHGHLAGVARPKDGAQHRRVGEGRRADDHPPGARRERLLDGLGAAQAAAVLHRHAALGGDPRELGDVHGPALFGAVEVDDVEHLGPGVHPRHRCRQRIGLVDLAGVEVPPDEPHGVALEDVDRRVEPHRGTGARPAARQDVAKLASIRRPAADDFSGWNWTPQKEPR